MITAIVLYKLPASINRQACRAHFENIAPGFRSVEGLISKHFIWSDDDTAGGVYQWQTIEDAEAFYNGPWLEGIVQRYGCEPQIDYFTTFCMTDNASGEVRIFEDAADLEIKD